MIDSANLPLGDEDDSSVLLVAKNNALVHVSNDIAGHCGILFEPDDVQGLLRGDTIITDDLAARLAKHLGSSPAFWKKREKRYREDLARLRQEASVPSSLSWLDELPLKDMTRWGWTEGISDPGASAAACLQFFGVPSVKSWREAYHDVLHVNAFRTSPTFKSHPGAVAAWLRQGEILASQIKCNPWNPDQFGRELAAIRPLTRVSNPAVFLPELEQRCAACGVAFVVLRAPAKCRASGATRFLCPTRPMLLLSFRYLSDDQFWFTFFHECGHLLLHGDTDIFLEGEGRITSEQEKEANRFAADTLIPPALQDEMMCLPPRARSILRFAIKAGVSRGIVVGQLQHRKRLRPNQLTKLKRFYQWRNE